MIENYEPTVQDVIDLKTYVVTRRKELNIVKNHHEGYKYIDPNHQYTYPNSTVLIINKMLQILKKPTEMDTIRY